MAESIDRSRPPLEQVVELMRILRSPSGCPWDRAQDFEDIAPYTIEEAYEVKDAIDRKNMDDLKSELGDLLFQVVFHSEIAAEQDAFNIDDVCETLVTKMIERHPHVFDDGIAPDWETTKANERQGRTLDGVAMALPALMRAQKLQKRAARVGFDWPSIDGVRAKVDEELRELASAESASERDEELGDLLFSVVNLARHMDVDSEAALRRANAKFEARFRLVEAEMGESLSNASLEDMEAAWTRAKSATHPLPGTVG